MTAPIRFGIVGTGWRSLFYLRIARALPDKFEVCGIVSRTQARADEMEREWGAKGYASLDEFLSKARPSFVVASVPWGVNPGLLRTLVDNKVPALSETPPAPDRESLVSLNEYVAKARGKVQVAEEYHRRPLHAAQLELAAGGMLGNVSHAQVSIGHGYHGISLIRRFLGIGYEPAVVTGKSFKSRIAEGPGRKGEGGGENTKESVQEITFFDFGDRAGVLDFSNDQYFSMIRNGRVLVRGERGEILNDEIVYLKDPSTPIRSRLVRHEGDLLVGVFLKGIQAGEKWVYRNPFTPASLTDDEVAIADCLTLMDEYARTGKEFYPLAEGSQDHYLYLSSMQAIKNSETVKTERQPWAR